MPTNATETSGSAAETGARGSQGTWWILPAALFLLSVAVTQPPFIADSLPYVDQIAAVRNGTAASKTLWEFGHILWRPLGFWFSGLFVSAIPNAIAWTPQLKILSGLVLFNEAAGLAGTLLIYALSMRLSGSRYAALVASILFVWGDAVLAYSQSGAPYILGLAVLLAGLWWQLTAREPGAGAVIGPACLFGFAGLLWLPFAIAIPSASCARRFIKLPGTPEREMSWYQCILSAAISGTLLLAGILAAAWLAGLRSVPDVVSWVISAGHGMVQNRRAIRAVSGFARLLIDLGADGVYLKRLVLHDPYFPVSVTGVIRSSLWKVGVFYVFVGSSVWLAWKSAARKSCIPLAIGAAVGAFAAVVVFEPSSPERLLPVLPFLLLALSAGWRSSWQWAGTLRTGIWVFAALLALLNLPSFEWRFSAEHHEAQTQAADFRKHAKPDDIMLVMTISEPISRLGAFDPINRPGRIHIIWILNPIDKDAAAWRHTVARIILDNWRSGKDAWVTTNAFSDRPNASSLWVEGDNPLVHWRDVPVFFRWLEFDPETSPVNGFARVRQSPANQERLARE